MACRRPSIPALRAAKEPIGCGARCGRPAGRTARPAGRVAMRSVSMSARRSKLSARRSTRSPPVARSWSRSPGVGLARRPSCRSPRRPHRSRCSSCAGRVASPVDRLQSPSVVPPVAARPSDRSERSTLRWCRQIFPSAIRCSTRRSERSRPRSPRSSATAGPDVPSSNAPSGAISAIFHFCMIGPPRCRSNAGRGSLRRRAQLTA